ncbi:MAG: hypothetical protein SGBAC_009005 [Bacillariaceae sp.]
MAPIEQESVFHQHLLLQESNDTTVWYRRPDLRESEVSELQTNRLAFVKEGIIKVNMMILTCSVLWQSCTWNSHEGSMEAMLECVALHFLDVTNVFLDYLRYAYCPPCISAIESDDAAFDDETKLHRL